MSNYNLSKYGCTKRDEITDYCSMQSQCEVRDFCVKGKRKIWDKYPVADLTKAKDVYIGPFATKCRQYAEKFYPSSWCILSAKYGFLFPDDIVPGPYNVSFNDRKTYPITMELLSAQAIKKGLKDYDEIVALGGRNYVEIVNEVFKEKKIITPLRDCKGNGYMMGLLNDSIKKAIICPLLTMKSKDF